MQKLILYLTFLVILTTASFGQSQEKNLNFYFDAILFKSDNPDTSGRLDVFVIVPYESLKFVSKNCDSFAAKYEIRASILDTNGNVINQRKFTESIFEENSFVVQGGNGAFENKSFSFLLKKGEYNLKVEIYDHVSENSFERRRTISVIDFENFDFSLSGIMLISSIEESGGKFRITPHVSDNLGDFESNYFVFFEAYNTREIDTVLFIHRYVDSENEIVSSSDLIKKPLKQGTNRFYLNVPTPNNLTPGTYRLQILAYQRNLAADTSSSDILAIAQRSVKLFRTMTNNVMSDLNLAIRQLRYVAYKEDIEYIQSGATEKEKQNRFEEFWRKRDPSPNTERNEAFDEYYRRVQFANENFRSYTTGWLTDMGMIYIIFGPPYNINSRDSFSDGRSYQVWQYSNGREIFFADNSGFGDFRLVRPVSITEKYQYQN